MAERDREPTNRRGPLIGLVVIVVLFALGFVLVRKLYSSEQLEDCLMSGRTNCAPIATPNR